MGSNLAGPGQMKNVDSALQLLPSGRDSVRHLQNGKNRLLTRAAQKRVH